MEYSASILGHSKVEMREALMEMDICLGADGAKSAARQLLFPSSRHPLVYRGYKVEKQLTYSCFFSILLPINLFL